MILDEELARRVAAGDRAAFMVLYERFAARVYGLCLRMLREPGAAEEVSQDTFLKVWKRAGQFDPARGPLLTWLLVIARRTALDWMRRESRRPAAQETAAEDTALDRLPDPRSQSEEARWRSLRLALQDLPDEQRAAIELAYYQAMSHGDIAEFLKVPLGTVKTRIRLGMDRLRRVWLAPQAADPVRSIPGESDA